MGTITQDVKCPNCGNKEAFEQTDADSIETQINCARCGYARRVSYKKDENGEPILKDKNGGHDVDNYIIEVNEIADPYGAFSVQYEDGMLQMGTLEDEDDMKEFEEWSEKLHKGERLKLIAVSRVVDGEKKVKVLYKKE